MSKISFNKLNLKKKDVINTVELGENVIEIKQYLPAQQKLKLLSEVLSASVENNTFFNPGQTYIRFRIAVVEYYTNISFTQKQKEDIQKTYDLLEENEIIDLILFQIPKKEWNTLEKWLKESAKACYNYNNSARGILDSLKSDYNNLDFDITSLQNKIKDPETLSLIKEIMPLLNLA